MANRRDGGPFYGRKVQREQLAMFAKPDRQPSGYVWWASGGDNYGVEFAKGVLPFAVFEHFTMPTLPNPPGCGGRWYATEEDAMADLKHALEKSEGQNSF